MINNCAILRVILSMREKKDMNPKYQDINTKGMKRDAQWPCLYL